jgi:hypothetical protein
MKPPITFALQRPAPGSALAPCPTRLLSAIFALVCAQLFAQAGMTVRTVYPPPGAPGFESVARQDVYTQEGKLFRVVHYFTPAASRDTGVQIQVDDYAGLEYPGTFTMVFTESFAGLCGFVRRVDKVDANDTLLNATFFLSDTISFTTTAAELETLDDFPVHRIGGYIADHASAPQDKPDAHHVEGTDLAGTIVVQYANSATPVSTGEAGLIAAWGSRLVAGVEPSAYTRRILVREAGIDIWVCVRDEMLSGLGESQHMVLQYYYVGRTLDGPTVIATHVRPLP